LLFVLARHAHSVLNLELRVNGDPAVDVPLTEEGQKEARLLGVQLAHIRLDLCVHTRFPRTRETAELAVAGRDVPLEVEPLLDDIDIGELEGSSLERYRQVKEELGRDRPFPGGESLDAAARRYATAFRGLVARAPEHVLVVCHEIPVRYALNAAAGSDLLDGPPFHAIPNAMPFFFDGNALSTAADRIERLAS
jgi:2,3-bisphosphoglycerate-dependent phosphoglycerate mutase